MTGALGAEVVRWRRSAPARLPLFALAAGLLQGALFLVSPRAVRTWSALEHWHTLWIAFAGPMALALLAGLAARRESRARGGGTWWRHVSPRRQHAASFLALAAVSLTMQVLVLLASLPFGAIARLDGPVPVGGAAALALVLWVTSLPALAVFDGVARRLGLVPALLAGAVAATLGTLGAERSIWWLDPFAWSVRATIPLSGDHANGVALEPASPLWHLSPLPMIALAVAVTPAAAWWAGRVLPGTARPARLLPEGRERRYRGVLPYRASAIRSELVKLRRTPAPWAAIAGPLLAAGVGAYYPPIDAWEVWALLAVPLGTALLAVQAWGGERGPWRVLRARPVRPSRLVAAKVLVLWAAWGVAGALLAAATALMGMPLGRVLTLLVLELAVSLLLTALSSWLAVRLGAGVALGAGILGTLLAVLLGGTSLGVHLWPAFPWTWAWAPRGGGAALPVVAASVALAALATWLAARAAARD